MNFDYFISLFSGNSAIDYFYLSAQLLGILLAVLAVASFQQKTPKKILVFQFLCDVCGVIHLAMLSKYTGQYMGAILYGFAGLRAVIFYLGNEHKWAANKIWIYALCCLYILSYILLFTVFGAEFNIKNALIEILPVIGTIIMTFGFHMQNAKLIRITYLIGAPFWLIYGVLVCSFGGVITESFNIISIIIGILRLDVKKRHTA